MDYEKIIANQIKKSRESAHLSQTELGIGALGFNKSDTNKAQKVISKIETGARDITAEEIYQIAKYLKKPLSYFFGGKQEEDKSDFKSGWTQEEIEYCQKLKDILASTEKDEITTLKKMIDSFTKERKSKKRDLKLTGT